MTRPSWDEYFMAIVDVVATRSQCLRAHVGAVIVNRDHRILGTGYNNPRPGVLSCEEMGSCLIVDRAGHGPSCRRTIHAEINAAMHLVGKHEDDCIMYTKFAPCNPCLEFIVKFGIKEIIYQESYDVVDTEREALLDAYDATTRRL